jgi:hypothetical protein
METLEDAAVPAGDAATLTFPPDPRNRFNKGMI